MYIYRRERSRSLLVGLVIKSTTLPHRCSYIDRGRDCPLSPSYIISIENDNDEYMIAVVCHDHRDRMESRLKAMQSKSTIPQGKTKFQEIRMVVTDCINAAGDE